MDRLSPLSAACRTARRLTWFGFLLTIAAGTLGCSTAAPLVRQPVAEYRMFLDPSLDPQGEHDGWTGELRIAPRVLEERTLTRHVVAHEIGHALGCSHVSGPAIMASKHGPGERAIEALTREEVRQARRSASRRVVVRLAPGTAAEVRDAAVWARNLWNEAIGADVVEIAAL